MGRRVYVIIVEAALQVDLKCNYKFVLGFKELGTTLDIITIMNFFLLLNLPI